jgi:hypothetical protein
MLDKENGYLVPATISITSGILSKGGENKVFSAIAFAGFMGTLFYKPIIKEIEKRNNN